mmetsp:Transcript_104/g.212  ORF Transcript_104/g.212 Transcript_104/m.212 type:complete len:228 (-) Transcript_104:231-914(-)
MDDRVKSSTRCCASARRRCSRSCLSAARCAWSCCITAARMSASSCARSCAACSCWLEAVARLSAEVVRLVDSRPVRCAARSSLSASFCSSARRRSSCSCWLEAHVRSTRCVCSVKRSDAAGAVDARACACASWRRIHMTEEKRWRSRCAARAISRATCASHAATSLGSSMVNLLLHPSGLGAHPGYGPATSDTGAVALSVGFRCVASLLCSAARRLSSSGVGCIILS